MGTNNFEVAEAMGYVKTYRTILQWEWFTDANTFQLFMYFLLSVNHTPKTWHGIELGIGQTSTSYSKISKATGMSVKEARTAMKHLCSTGDISVNKAGLHTIVTVCNYGIYQQKSVKNKRILDTNLGVNLDQNLDNRLDNGLNNSLGKVAIDATYCKSVNCNRTEQHVGIDTDNDVDMDADIDRTKCGQGVGKHNKNDKNEKKNIDKANALYAISGLSESKILNTTMEYFNSSIDKNKSGLRKIRSISNDRRRLTLARYKEYGLDGIKQMIDNATTSDFLGNPSDKWHGADFNWLMKPNNFPKVLEGKYNNADTPAGNGQQGSADDDGYADFLKFCKSNTPNLYEKIKSIGNHALYEFKRLSGGDGRKTSNVLEAMDRDNFQGDLFEEFDKRIRCYG